MTDRITSWELDRVVEEVTTLPPDHLAIVQVRNSIDKDKAHALLSQIPEKFRGRVMLLVGHDEVFTVDEAVLLAAREAVRQERGISPRPVRDAPQA